MSNFVEILVNNAWLLLPVFLGLVALLLAKSGNILVFVGNDEVGILERKWSIQGKKGHFLALGSEAGFCPDVLRGGIHFLFPFMYALHKQPLITIPQGTIGYVFARDGKPLEPGQALARLVEACRTFEDVLSFISNDGERGLQRRILREGTYAINTAQFVVFAKNGTFFVPIGSDDSNRVNQMREIIDSRDGFLPVVISPAMRGGNHLDSIGIVTIHDGPSLAPGEIIAPTISPDKGLDHDSFQKPDDFLTLGGKRGRQEQVLADGTFYINRIFATVEMAAKTSVDIGKVGVVVSFTGPPGEDTTDVDYRYGQLVKSGCKGVWKESLPPGKYALNTYACKVIPVPTTNFVLRWAKGRTEAHGLDAKLEEIKLITRDAFEPILPLSVVLHIANINAPLVVQRFGDVKELVDSTLDPLVSAFFKDAAQSRTLIDLINQRAELQKEAKEKMAPRFAEYNLDLKEVLVGTPRSQDGDNKIAQVLDQLRLRQIAVEQVGTYESQKHAADKQRELNESVAISEAQTALSKSKIQISVQENEASAKLAAARKEAEALVVAAEAQASQVKLQGEAEASKITAVGNAQATATKAQVDAFGGAEYQLTKDVAGILAQAISTTHQPIVPTISMGGGSNASPMEALLGMVLSQMNKTQNP